MPFCVWRGRTWLHWSLQQSDQNGLGVLCYGTRRIGNTPTRWREELLVIVRTSWQKDERLMECGLWLVYLKLWIWQPRFTCNPKQGEKLKLLKCKQQESINKKQVPASVMILVESFWARPEAKKLFLGSSTNGQNVVEGVQQQKERLQLANQADMTLSITMM